MKGETNLDSHDRCLKILINREEETNVDRKQEKQEES